MIILHYTGTRHGREAREALCAAGSGLSFHYLVDEDGSVWRLVAEDRRAWHAGASSWRGHRALDDRAVGVAMVNPGHGLGYRDFPVLQLAAACDTCLAILSRHPIPARNIVAHSDVAPEREQDPGERFDWEQFARNGVGLFPRDISDLGSGGPLRDSIALQPIRAGLREVGYDVAPEGPLNPSLSAVLRAFQRHWRPEAITGQADQGTVARLAALVLALTQAG